MNDLWMFNVTTRLWTWFAGNNSINQVGSYGIRGIASVGNYPGCRESYSMELDTANQVIYVFGGGGLGVTATVGKLTKYLLIKFNFSQIKGNLNDFWMFNLTARLWTWVAGSGSINQFGIYGTRGISASSNYPGARWAHSMVIDTRTEVGYIFGGMGYLTSQYGRITLSAVHIYM